MHLVPPYPFGYKSIWLAIQTAAAPGEVAERLAVYALCGNVINRSVDGFVLVEGVDDLCFDGRDNPDDPHLNLLRSISEDFGLVCFFVSHRVSDVYQWAKLQDGVLLRAHSFCEMEAWDFGTDEAEDALGLDLADTEEEDVIRVAAAWSTNPLSLEGTPPESPSPPPSPTSPSAKKTKPWKALLLLLVFVLIPTAAKITKVAIKAHEIAQKQQNSIVNTPIELTIDPESHIVTRPASSAAKTGLRWAVKIDGQNFKNFDATDEMTFLYEPTELQQRKPHTYTILLIKHIDGTFQAVSNEVSFDK